MGGQRHSKNAGTMGVEGLTYHEKKALGFGTVKQRLGKVLDLLCWLIDPHSLFGGIAALHLCRCFMQDSVGNYNDCRLTLQPAVVSRKPTSFTSHNAELERHTTSCI